MRGNKATGNPGAGKLFHGTTALFSALLIATGYGLCLMQLANLA